MTLAQAVTILSICGFALAAALLYGASALWVVHGRGNIVSRIAPAALLLAALAPIGAYELIAVFGAQVITIIGWVLLGRLVRSFRGARSSGESARGAMTSAVRDVVGDKARFRLRELLQFVLLAALVLAIVRFAAPLVGAGGGAVNWRVCLLIGLIVGITMIAADWLVFGKVRWYFRIAAIIFGSAAFGGLLYLFEGVNSLIGAGLSFFFAVALALVRMADWSWWRPIVDADKPVTDGRDLRPTRPWWRRPARAVVAVTAIAGLSFVIAAYWVMLPISPPTIELPKPNGYDELLQVAGAINWSAIPSQDWEAASTGACRKFVLDNSGSLALLRDALQKPNRVPLAFDANFIARSLPNIQRQRELCRALAAEARLAGIEGRHGDAADSYCAMLQLGNVAGNGGLMVHDLVGMALGGVGLQGTASILPQLDAVELASLRQRLIAAAAKHDPIDQVLERERQFAQCSSGWAYRIWLWLDDAGIESSLAAFASARQRYDALMNLILAEAAVRQYELEHGEPPESLTALVPKYLAAVPSDPHADGPLVYRRTDSGYLLYSVGINGRDDGGVRAMPNPPTPGAGTDLFFDTPER